MKANNFMEYTTPEVNVCLVKAERGFEASFGDAGYAGDDYDINDKGSF